MIYLPSKFSGEIISRDFSPQLPSILGMQKASRPAKLHEQFLAEKKRGHISSLHLFETWSFVKQGQQVIIRKWSKAVPTAVAAQVQVDEANLRLLKVINSTLSQLLKTLTHTSSSARGLLIPGSLFYKWEIKTVTSLVTSSKEHREGQNWGQT